MMGQIQVSREQVLEHSRSMRSFPRIIAEILATIDDPDGSVRTLAQCIEHDPIITARVLSAANRASERGRRESGLLDIYAATSLIGMSRVREIALISTLNGFVDVNDQNLRARRLWQHCVSVGVCSQELALNITSAVCTDTALVAGLLHDIGQFWFHSFDAAAYQACWSEARRSAIPIEELERAHFGADHSSVGAWLAQDWELPAEICAAIQGHHVPGCANLSPLVDLVHVAEVLSNALNLSGGNENRVRFLSSASCERLGLVWDASAQALFGRIEARSQQANQFFCGPGAQD